MLNIGPQELLLILIVALLVVGPKRLPELGRTIGRGLRELRKAQDEVQRTIRGALDEPAPPRATAKPATVEPPREPAPATPAEPITPAAGEVGEAGAEPNAPAGPDGAETDASEVARSLGQGLAELRRVREEIQRTFRMDLDERDRPAE